MRLSLRDRLQRLGVIAEQPLGDVAHRAAAVASPLRVPGKEVATPSGTCIVRTASFPLDHSHGATRLRVASDLPPEQLAVAGKLPGYERLAPERRLYLDTETTSLSGGAGVLVFLVGVGRFESDAFVVRQLFMRDPSEEPAMLDVLTGLLETTDALVSFCGRTFDAPRARDRYLFQNRPLVEARLRELPHLDLHPAARRLFGHRLPDNRLRTLEERELGFHRTSDLPGAECPEAYFAYLRGTANRIPEVMEHNLQDILSLATLEARVATGYASPDDAGMALAAGVLAHDHADDDRARVHLSRAAADLPPLRDHLPLPLSLRAARALRRLGCPGPARTLLERTMVCWPEDLRPCEALAILHERDLGDRRAATAVVERGLLIARDATDRARLLHRHRRLRAAGARASACSRWSLEAG